MGGVWSRLTHTSRVTNSFVVPTVHTTFLCDPIHHIPCLLIPHSVRNIQSKNFKNYQTTSSLITNKLGVIQTNTKATEPVGLRLGRPS